MMTGLMLSPHQHKCIYLTMWTMDNEKNYQHALVVAQTTAYRYKSMQCHQLTIICLLFNQCLWCVNYEPHNISVSSQQKLCFHHRDNREGIKHTHSMRVGIYAYGNVVRAVCVFTGTSHLIPPVSRSDEGGIWWRVTVKRIPHEKQYHVHFRACYDNIGLNTNILQCY